MVPAVFGGIVVIGVLTRSASLHYLCDLKALKSMQCCLIGGIILYKFELGHKHHQSIKNICCMKGEGAVDHCKVNKK